MPLRLFPLARRLLRACLALSVALPIFAGAQALFPAAQPLNDLQHTAWTQKDGVPGTVMAIAQTSDGYLWIGTGTGLFRFDGLRFERFESLRGQVLPSQGVLALQATKDRGLWVGLIAGGAARVRDGRIEYVEPAKGLFDTSVRAFATDREGRLWLSTGRALLRRDGDRWTHVDKELGLGTQDPGKRLVLDVKADGDGNLWVVTHEGLYLKPAGGERFGVVDLPGFDGHTILSKAPDGRMWATAALPGRAGKAGEGTLRLYRLPRPGAVGAQDARDDWRPVTQSYFGALLDHHGGLWYGAEHGLARERTSDLAKVDPAFATRQQPQRFTVEQGLTGDRVLTSFEDRDGSVWVGTSGGLDRFRAAAVDTLRFESAPTEISMTVAPDGALWLGASNQPLQRLPLGASALQRAPVEVACTINDLLFDREQRLWQGCSDGFWRQDGVRNAKLPASFWEPWRGAVRGMVEDRAGTVWAIANGMSLVRYRDGQWARVHGQSGIPARPGDAIALDAKGRVVIGYANGELAFIENDRATVIDASSGLRLSGVKTVTVRGDHTWIAGSSGIQLISAPGMPWLQTADPSATADVTGLVETPQGDLWLNGSSGITRIAADEVRRALADPAHPMAFRRIDSLDGLNGRAEQSVPLKTAVQTPDGRLWFSLTNGVVSIDPKRPVRAMADLAIDVQRVLVDGEPATQRPEGDWQLPAGSRELQIDYTAPGARIAERVRFRYRLEGPDGRADTGARDGGGWREVGNRRQAFFTNLAPGRYRFELQASDDGGPWSSQAGVITIALAPTLTQTWWFRAGAGLMAALVVAGLVALRLRHVAAREREKLMVRLQERERIAQDLHDTLLQSVLSLILRFQGFVRRLPEGERAGLQQVLDDADALWTEGRNRVKDLRLPPPAAGSVEQSLRRLGEGLAQSHDTAFHLRVEGDARPLDPLRSAELCLVAREAIFNAFQHARASRVDVVVQHEPDVLRVEVRDDGVGIPEALLQAGARDGHWGLTGMRERAERAGARFELVSSDGGGTTVRVDLPTEA